VTAPNGVQEQTTTTAERRTVSLFGLKIDQLTMDETVDRIDQLIASGGIHQHVAINVSKVVQAEHDPSLRAVIETCDVINADGQPIIWAARLLGVPLRERVTGIDLMTRLIERAAERGHRLYLLGARREVVEAVAERIEREHPTAVVAGWRDGYWQADEESSVVASIAEARPDILFVAISSPTKEQFLARWKATIGAPFVMGVGGSFDVYSGVISRAPNWMRRVGLEWLYRVYQEPRRMWRRYLGDAPQFAWLLLRARLGKPDPRSAGQ
jgi:N-acetylglucosaminyldiphosphoundecaprenol N-acetyl-beta-D-mannosaminyltransferase